MKVIGFNSSPRKDGNTQILIRKVFEVLEKEGIETELVQLGGEKIRGCRACFKCYDNKDCRCSVDNDVLNGFVGKMVKADGIILGSPVYFSNVNTEAKALIDRAGLVSTANGGLFKHKVGAAVVAVRRAGAIPTFDALNHFFMYHQMIVPGSCYWNMALGRKPGEVETDEEGMNIMKVLGENMVWLLKKLQG